MTDKGKYSGAVGRKYIGGKWIEYTIKSQQGVSKYQAKVVNQSDDMNIHVTIRANGTGTEIARTLSTNYGAVVITHDRFPGDSNITVECQAVAVDDIKEYLDANENVLDYDISEK